MPCVPVPAPQIPTPPAGISTTPTIAAPTNVGGNLCCQSLSFTTPALPVPLPAIVVNPALIATVRSANLAIRAWRDSITLPCPRQ